MARRWLARYIGLALGAQLTRRGGRYGQRVPHERNQYITGQLTERAEGMQCGWWCEEVCGWIRTFQTLEKATSLAPSRPVRLERAACQRRRVGVQGGRVRAAAREQLLHSLRHTCTLYGTWKRVGTCARRRCGSNGLGTAHVGLGEVYSALGSCGAVAGLAHSLERPLHPRSSMSAYAPAVNSVSVNSVFGCWPPPKQRLGG